MSLKWSRGLGSLLAAIWLLNATTSLATQTLVRVGAFDFNPLCRTQGVGKIEKNAGLFPAILSEVASKEYWSLEYIPGSLPECMKRLDTGEVDLVVAATYSKEAEEKYSFTRETVISTWAQVYTSNKTRLQSMLDLAGRNIGVVRDDPYILEIRTLVQRLGIQCTFAEFNTYGDIFKALDQKWIDTGVIDRIYATLHENDFRVQRTSLIFSPVELRFASAKGKSQALIDALDYHLAEFKKNPKSFYYEQITAILGMSKENQALIYLKWSLFAAGGLLLVALAAGLIMRYEIKVKTGQLFQKNSELQKELAQRKMAESRHLRQMTAIEQSDDAIIITDQYGVLQYANPAFESTTGFSRTEMVGEPLEYLAKLPISSMTNPDSCLPAHPWKGRFTCNKKEGGEYAIDATVSPVHSPEGEITHYAWVCRDVTNEAHMERHLRLAQKMEAIGTLAGGIAHDINNILFPIIGYTEMVRKSMADDDPQRRKLDSVLVSADRAKDLVQQILSFSRQREESRIALQIAPIVKETLRLLRASIPSTIEISQTIEMSSHQVMADPTQIHQVLMNLCTNAYHAMREKGGVLSVVVKEVEVTERDIRSRVDRQPGYYTRISISDTGCGMERSTLERIYDPYFTTKAPGEGTGLGLFLVHGIVKSHDGFIDVYSEAGMGTKFQIYLPIAEAGAEGTQSLPADVAMPGTGHILLIDDEEAITAMLKDLLEDLGYCVTISNSSVDALSLFRANPGAYDLVITDQTMPHLTGIELAKSMTQLRAEIPVILCSGFCDLMTDEESRALGIRRIVTKPVLCNEFSFIVRRVLDEVPV